MPVYVYKRESTGETREVVQGMNDEHSYRGEDGSEEDWKRVWLVPRASIDSHIDPFSQDEFVEKTRNKRGTYGDVLDASAELSEKRSDKLGHEDPVKRKYFDDYSKLRKGGKHPKDREKVIDTPFATVELD